MGVCPTTVKKQKPEQNSPDYCINQSSVTPLVEPEAGFIREATFGSVIRQKPVCALAGVSLARQSARTSRKPSSIRRIADAGTRPTLSVRQLLSSVTTWDTLTTEFTFKPVPRVDSSTFPGATARDLLEVTAATTTVRIALRLNSFVWMINTGRR